jgi:hypothetical protein
MIRRAILLLLLAGCGLGFADRKSSNLAMLLCLIPGSGQFYTERYIPGVLIAGAELTLSYYAYQAHEDRNYPARNSLLWWDLFVFGYSVADAYVGAKLHGFEIETDLDKVSIQYNFRW